MGNQRPQCLDVRFDLEILLRSKLGARLYLRYGLAFLDCWLRSFSQGHSHPHDLRLATERRQHTADELRAEPMSRWLCNRRPTALTPLDLQMAVAN